MNYFVLMMVSFMSGCISSFLTWKMLEISMWKELTSYYRDAEQFEAEKKYRSQK
jgi:hypothetical protein